MPLSLKYYEWISSQALWKMKHILVHRCTVLLTLHMMHKWPCLFLWKCQKIQTTKGVWFYFQRNIFWYIFSPLWGEKVWATFSHRKSHCGKLLNVIVLQITEDLTVEMWLKWLLKNKIKQNKTTTKKAITTMEKNKNKKCMKQSLKKIQKDCTSHCRMACNINVLKMSVFKPH